MQNKSRSGHDGRDWVVTTGGNPHPVGPSHAETAKRLRSTERGMGHLWLRKKRWRSKAVLA